MKKHIICMLLVVCTLFSYITISVLATASTTPTGINIEDTSKNKALSIHVHDSKYGLIEANEFISETAEIPCDKAYINTDSENAIAYTNCAYTSMPPEIPAVLSVPYGYIYSKESEINVLQNNPKEKKECICELKFEDGYVGLHTKTACPLYVELALECICKTKCIPTLECTCELMDSGKVVHGENCLLSELKTVKVHINPDCSSCSTKNTDLQKDCKGETSMMMEQSADDIWDGSVDTTWYTNNTDATSFTISTAAELAGLAQLVNNRTQNFKDKTVNLGANIKLNDTSNWENWDKNPPANSWKPIGTYSKPFSGTFDGKDYTVSGMYINHEYYSYVGLFGYFAGTTQNVTVAESFVRGTDCVGGVVGFSDSGIIKNCKNSGTVSGDFNVGGVVGCGYIVIDCNNSGTVRGGLDYVGGVVGSQSGTIENCNNSGTVSGNEYVGGVVGVNQSNTISNCHNSGTVSGLIYIGGVVGWKLDGTVKNCTSPKGLIKDATGDIGDKYSPEFDKDYKGHIIGKNDNGICTGNSTDGFGGITVNPTSTILKVGVSQAFSIGGIAEGDSVTWSVAGGISGTMVTDGTLAIAEDETARTLYITGLVNKTDGSYKGFVTVTVTVANLTLLLPQSWQFSNPA